MSVCPSAWPNWVHTERISMKLDVWVVFENLSRKFRFHYNLTRITGTLHADRYTFLTISRSVLLRMRNVSDKRCTENQNTFCVHFFFFRKSWCLWGSVEKYCRGGQATGGNMAHAHCMLDTYGYRHTLRICNTCCLYWTPLSVTFYVHCLCCVTVRGTWRKPVVLSNTVCVLVIKVNA